MMEYGVRPGEARALQKDCLADRNVIIRRAFSDNELRETTKTGRIRIYQITAYFQTVLDRIQPHLSPFVFVRDDGKPYTSKKRLLRSRYLAICENSLIFIYVMLILIKSMVP